MAANVQVALREREREEQQEIASFGGDPMDDDFNMQESDDEVEEDDDDEADPGFCLEDDSDPREREPCGRQRWRRVRPNWGRA